MSGVRRAGAAIAVGLLLAGSAAAQTFSPQTFDRYFRIEWQRSGRRTGPTIEGYVYNQAVQAAERMRLQIDCLDASGGVVGHSTVWLLGDIPKNGRAFFRATVPEAASYRVPMLAFDWNCSDGGGM